MSVRGIRISPPGGPGASPRGPGGPRGAPGGPGGPSEGFGVGGIGYAALNQNTRCIVAATRRGFVVYSTEPFKKTFQRELIPCRGEDSEEESRCCISLVEMLYTCNILGVVGKGHGELWRESTCVLWDDRQARSIVQLDFADKVVKPNAKKIRRLPQGIILGPVGSFVRGAGEAVAD
ncbi:hypothetical protein, conserved [Eimeria necatrix]|uniref:Uncharacterized protein n=1 Tax=Eimeria necatrix TaxID=51315 RepID=U6MMF7_9EIME|nr:hypothetical protein, conserved [Eimeria necatrix]CDJ62840.1 hypothetical protein, conserved [Eimeria necatrix]